MKKIVPTISSGGENIFIKSGKNGKTNKSPITKLIEPNAINDFTNFLASLTLCLPMHCPTTVITARLIEPPPICINPERDEHIAFTVRASVPISTIKVCVKSFPPLKNICSAAKGRPIRNILFCTEKSTLKISTK